MPEPRAASGVPEPARDRLILGRKWAYLLQSKVYLAREPEDFQRELIDLLDVVCAAVHDEPARARAVGARLVAIGFKGDEALPCTLDVLGRGLLGLPEFQPVAKYAEQVMLTTGALASGFSEANRRATFEQQESMKLSLLKAVRDAKWNLKVSEAKFDEVAMSSASGIIITSTDGRLVRANNAIADILGYSPDELLELTLFDIVHPEFAPVLREDYQSLLNGNKERIKQPQRLMRKDGDIARITLTASLLRSDEGVSQFVTVIEDGTELMLLQQELNRQALHDVLTGLPNRQYFSTSIETAMRRANPEHGVTLFHLDLDAFAMICNGLGRRVGDHLLVTVSQRLKAVVAAEKAMVARFDGDEFGILVENSSTTPNVTQLVARFNEELSEPVYVDGHGVAVSASIGVVYRPSLDLEPAELLRAADFTLRRAKAAGRGQWELFDPDQDARDRRTYTLAAGMPGAWETGEIQVVYRPVVDLAANRIAGVETLLQWGQLPHSRCIELAERTGLMLPLGEWQLNVASRQAGWWRQRFTPNLPLLVGLTPHQSSDADLVSRVVRTADDPAQLITAIARPQSPEALDNAKVLADMGVRVVLDEFGTAPEELIQLEDLPVGAVRVAGRLVDRQPESRALSSSLMTLVYLVHEAGARVIVDGVRSAAQAEWWRQAGADWASGSHFGTAKPPGELADRLS